MFDGCHFSQNVNRVKCIEMRGLEKIHQCTHVSEDVLLTLCNYPLLCADPSAYISDLVADRVAQPSKALSFLRD